MKSKIFGILLPAMMLLFGCSKELDTTPFNNIEQQNALKTSADVEGLLVGAYGDLGATDLYGGGAFVTADLLADFNEISWSGTYQGMTQIKTKTIPVDNSFVEGTWTESYKTINDVNTVLNALSLVSDVKKDRVEGEAKFIRASVYFDLVRLFAKDWNNGTPASNPGVPVKLTPTTDVSGAADQIPRATVQEVYTQVLKDLTEAKALLPDENGFFADKYTASAMLARVYLQQGDFAAARDEADTVIESGKYALTGTTTKDGIDIIDEFLYTGARAKENTKEDIFAMQVNTTSGVNTFQTYYSELGRNDIAIKDAHYDLYEPNDLRLNLISSDGYVTKFDNVYGNVHIIRLAEMYLIRAEANEKLHSSIGAEPVDDINVIRARAGLDLLTSVTRDDILKERKIELSFEGFNLHDIKRLKVSTGYFTSAPGDGLPFDSPKLIFPIPKRDILVNPNLTQNEGY